jgi:hypothetical protein
MRSPIGRGPLARHTSPVTPIVRPMLASRSCEGRSDAVPPSGGIQFPPDQSPAKSLMPPPIPPRAGEAPSDSSATAHDGAAIIWPGGNSGSQEAGGTLPPRLRGEAGREAAQHHSHQPSCCFPHAAERKGAVMLSEAKHLKSRPTKTPRSHPNLLPQCPRSASVRHAQGRFANRLCCAAAAWQLMHSMLANPPSTYG